LDTDDGGAFGRFPPDASASGPTPRVGELPAGYWTREEVLANHNRFNGMVRSASKYLSDPAIKLWFVSLFQFCKQVMEGENLL